MQIVLSDFIMRNRAFIDDENKLFDITYYHTPSRWIKYAVDESNPIADESNWSKEIKYLNETNDDISDDIKNIPNDTGGIYMFFLKGISLSFIEKYIVYIGRCQYTDSQNIRKRAREYFSDNRDFIKGMFSKWKQFVYYRYYPDTDNERIKMNEAILLNALWPPFNPTIPDKTEVQPTINAF